MRLSIIFIAIGVLLGGKVKAAVTCDQVVEALGVKKSSESLGYAGALNITDLRSGEVVRIFISQTGRFQNQYQDRYDFKVGAVMPQTSANQLFTDLDAKTNLQLVDLPQLTDGCIVAFSGRQLGPTATLIQKKIQSIQADLKTIELAASNYSGPLSSSLLITYHGKNMD